MPKILSNIWTLLRSYTCGWHVKLISDKMMLNGKLKICWNIILIQFNPSPYQCYIMFAYLLFIIHAHIEQRILLFLNNFPRFLTTIKLWSLPLPHGFDVNSASAICLFVTSSGLICYNISNLKCNTKKVVK